MKDLPQRNIFGERSNDTHLYINIQGYVLSLVLSISV